MKEKEPRWYVEIRDCGIYSSDSLIGLTAQIGFHLAYRALRDISNMRLSLKPRPRPVLVRPEHASDL